LGLHNKLVEKQDPNVWLCSTCQKCVELCPQKVELTEIFTLIKNRCFEESEVPSAFISQGKTIVDNGVAIPYSNSILSRRNKLGLPEVKTASMEEIKQLLKETNFEYHINRRGE
jgi:heterodisulfide reductase subunit C